MEQLKICSCSSKTILKRGAVVTVLVEAWMPNLLLYFTKDSEPAWCMICWFESLQEKQMESKLCSCVLKLVLLLCWDPRALTVVLWGQPTVSSMTVTCKSLDSTCVRERVFLKHLQDTEITVTFLALFNISFGSKVQGFFSSLEV